jgi:hypothetical protein
MNKRLEEDSSNGPLSNLESLNLSEQLNYIGCLTALTYLVIKH